MRIISVIREAHFDEITARGGAVAARRAHNPKVVGSNPTPATNFVAKYHRFHLRNRWFFVFANKLLTGGK